MRFGLVLGGGGVVGIAWEIGVLAGLERAGALTPAEADVIVGTSAGSVVGARLALGQGLEDLVVSQRASASDGATAGTDAGADAAAGAAAAGGGAAPDMRAVMEIFAELRQAPAVTPEVTRVVGAKAMAAATPSEERWVAGFEGTLGGGTAPPWPSDRDLRVAALDCHTGERRLWTRADADVAPLATAVASSCAVPGLFPTVAIGGSRYTDGGVWSATNGDVLVGESLDAVVLVVPTAGAPALPGRRPAHEVDAEVLAADGVRTVTVTPGPAFVERVGLMNLMNPAKREAGLEVGLEDGAAAAGAVRAALAGAS